MKSNPYPKRHTSAKKRGDAGVKLNTAVLWRQPGQFPRLTANYRHNNDQTIRQFVIRKAGKILWRHTAEVSWFRKRCELAAGKNRAVRKYFVPCSCNAAVGVTEIVFAFDNEALQSLFIKIEKRLASGALSNASRAHLAAAGWYASRIGGVS